MTAIRSTSSHESEASRVSSSNRSSSGSSASRLEEGAKGKSRMPPGLSRLGSAMSRLESLAAHFPMTAHNGHKSAGQSERVALQREASDHIQGPNLEEMAEQQKAADQQLDNVHSSEKGIEKSAEMNKSSETGLTHAI